MRKLAIAVAADLKSKFHTCKLEREVTYDDYDVGSIISTVENISDVLCSLLNGSLDLALQMSAFNKTVQLRYH